MIEFKTVFVDTSVFIYFLEENKRFIEKANDFFEYCLSNDVELKTSTITFMEFSVKPYEKGKIEVVNKFKDFLVDFDIQTYNINIEIADSAARLRSKYKWLKSMDALQLSVALFSESDIFITNDLNLQKIKEIDVALIKDWIRP
jgi:predicted nucleic acid-binding protein